MTVYKLLVRKKDEEKREKKERTNEKKYRDIESATLTLIVTNARAISHRTRQIRVGTSVNDEE